MIRRAPHAVLLAALHVSGLLALGACSDKEPEPQTIPVPSAASAAPVAADPGAGSTAAPTDTAAPGASALTPPPTDSAAPTTPRVGGGNIDACCAGLSAITRSGKSPDAKKKASTAYTLCNGLNSRVKAGQVTRASAFTTIRNTLGDVAAPAECR